MIKELLIEMFLVSCEVIVCNFIIFSYRLNMHDQNILIAERGFRTKIGIFIFFVAAPLHFSVNLGSVGNRKQRNN
jgi:hypothetical protein